MDRQVVVCFLFGNLFMDVIMTESKAKDLIRQFAQGTPLPTKLKGENGDWAIDSKVISGIHVKGYAQVQGQMPNPGMNPMSGC